MARAEMLELKDIDTMIKLLTEKRFQMEADACLTEQTLLQDFLAHLKRLKDDQLIQLKRETSVIQSDLEKITNQIKEIKIQSHDRVPENLTTERKVADDFCSPLPIEINIIDFIYRFDNINNNWN